MNKVVSLALFVAATVAVSSAIKCYTCGGGSGDACGDPFKSGDETDCNPGGGLNANLGISISITTCSKTKVGAGGASTVVRACGLPGSSTGCTKVETDAGSGERCICEGDKCNSAGFAKVSLVALVATLAVPFVLIN